MASTIQIKRGTGSAVPSGLADGELAINLDNGRLYFGSGSTSVNDFSFGEITAEKYIVSSSVLYVTTSFSSGSTEFGDTVDDTHTFTGNITASGDISASGVLYADKWGSEYVGNNISMVTDNRIDFNPSNTTAVRLSDSLVTLNKDTKILGNVTASGNISASGTIVGFTLSGINTGDQNISNLAITGSDVIFTNITASGNISSSGNVYGTGFNSQGYTIGNYDTGLGAVAIARNTNIPIVIGKGLPAITINGNITASGDISASGKIYSGEFFGEGDPSAIGSRVIEATSTEHNFGSAARITKMLGTAITLNAPVTASGNISSSGGILANSLTVDGVSAIDTNGTTGRLFVNGTTDTVDIGKAGTITSTILRSNVTASGNISASGTITAAALDINGISTNTINVNSGDSNVAINASSTDADCMIRVQDNSTAGTNVIGLVATGDDSIIRNDEGNFKVKMANNATTTLDLNQNGDLFLTGNVTSSGNISSSGEIKANTLDIASTSNFADDITIGDTKKIIGARLTISASDSTNFYGTTTFNDTISDVTSTGTVTAADVFINGDLNSGTPILSFSSSQTPQGGIAYYDSGDIARYAFFFPSPDVVSIANRASNGTVQIRANNATVGGDGEVTSSIFTSFSNEFLLPVTASGDISASGDIYATDLELDDATESTINMYQAGTQRIKISGRSGQDTYFNAGDVAIGTDTPAEKLTVEGNISASGTITADRFLGSQLTMVPFNYYVSANHSTELYIPQGGSQVESNYDNPYHLMLAPYDGKVRRVSVYYQTGDPGDLTARVRKAAAPFDIDDADDIVQEETISSAVDDTAYFFDFSASFSKGDAVALTLEAASHASNCYVVGTIAVEYDTTT